MRSRDELFYYGIISLWENWAFHEQKVIKEISDDLMHILAVFRLWRAPEGPWGSPMVPNGQPSVPWEVEMNYSTTGLFHYGRTGRFTNKRWSEKYLMIWCIFWPFSGSEGPPEGPWGSPMDNLVSHEKSRWIILLWDYSRPSLQGTRD